MADLHLRTVTRTQGNNRALKDGTVTPEGATFDFEEIPVLVQGFRRMVRSLEFDVCEMALTTYLTAKAHGVPFTAVPAFLVRSSTTRRSRWTRDTGSTRPMTSMGRRRRQPGYTVTTGAWARAILAPEYGPTSTTYLDALWRRARGRRPSPGNLESIPPAASSTRC